jgi:hypothetical protein
MNRLEVRALGWVVTRDVISEIAQASLGRQRRIPLAALQELGDRWCAVHASPTADQPEPHATLPAGKFTTSLSKQRAKAVVEFIDSLQACSPGLYSEQALRHRYLNAARQAVASFALGAILAHSTLSDIPIIGNSVIVLFAIACWSCVATVELWRTHDLVARINRLRRIHGPSPADHWPVIRIDRDGPRAIDREHRRPSKS